MSALSTFLSAVLSVSVFAADQTWKNASEDHRLPAQGRTRTGGLFFSNYHNEGAALNLGQKNPLLISSIALSMTLFCTALFLATMTRKGAGLLKYSLALLLGGAWSNLYDRLKRKYVVDYIAFQLPDGHAFRELIFNVADLCIAVGAALLSIRGIGKTDEA